MVVGLDLQDEKVELGQVQIEEQDAQVEDEDVDKSLEETLDELAILEESYQDWQRSSMTERFAYEKRYLYGRKAPVPSTCDAVEALLRHELLAHLPDWFNRKADVDEEVW